jgi:hypothetical protein
MCRTDHLLFSFSSCKAGALLLVRRSVDATPSEDVQTSWEPAPKPLGRVRPYSAIART